MSAPKKCTVYLQTRVSFISVAIFREGSALWLEVAGVVTMQACEELMSVLRAEVISTPTTGVAIDFRRTVWAMSPEELGKFGQTMHHLSIRQPVAIISPPGAIQLSVRSAFVDLMAELGHESAFFEEPGLARIHLAQVACPKTKTARSRMKAR